MHIRNVILDWSGTLVNDLPPVLDTTNHVFANFGVPALTLDEFRREFCLPIRKFYERRIPHAPQAKLEEVFLARFHEVQDQITLLPHALGFLKFCREAGLGTYIASTVDADTYQYQSKRFGLTGWITKPYVGIEDKRQRIHHILEENQLTPDATLFVGDMEHDIEAGQHGGVRTCAVLTGYNHVEKLRAMEPDLVCEDLGELQQWIESQSKTSK